MSQENVELVERLIAAINDRDIETYLACCAEDVQVQTPWAPIAGVYEGSEGIRRFFADVVDAGPDFHISADRVQSVGANRVLAHMRVNISGRASGIQLASDTPTTNVYEIDDGKIKRIRIFLDRRDALEAVGLSEPEVSADS